MRSHRLLLVAALAAVLAGMVVTGGSAVGSPGGGSPTATAEPPPDQLLAPGEGRDRVWPYTSRHRSMTGRTLALNVVVRGDTERVRRLLGARTEANWSRPARNATVVVSPWRPAHGSTRYTYVTPAPNTSGRWVTPDYQVAVGTYFGRRTHVRAYGGPSGDWTAMQAHREYWDWFRLRHTVTGVATGAQFVGDDLRDEPGVERVSRVEHGLTGGGSGGRWTVIDLVPAILVGGVAVPLVTRRRAASDVLLPVALLLLVLGLRAWGLAAEAVAPGVTPKPFAAVGYLALVVGPPVLVATLGRNRPAPRTALLAAAGLEAGIILDMAVAGIQGLPEAVVFHRVALATTLGLLAGGVAREDRLVIGAGVVAWLLALAAPLFGVV